MEQTMKKTDVTALGELLIDFTQNGLSAQGNFLMEANPGGAPCNVLAMLTKLGHKTAFIGKVGNDFLGRHLKSVIEEVGIDSRCLKLDEEVHTTLAFVHTYEDGDRDFSFYRNPGADMNLTEDEIDEALIADSRLFHFGSLSMTHESVFKATVKALELAKKHDCLISYDPNLREPLWDTLEHAREKIAYGMQFCDVLKISDNEILWFTGMDDYDEGAKYLQETYHIPLILVSMGRDGSRAFYKDMRVEVPAFAMDNTIETTGAGDTFGACVIDYVLKHGLDDLTEAELIEMLTFANAAAALVTTKKGALKMMPEVAEVEKLVSDKGTVVVTRGQ